MKIRIVVSLVMLAVICFVYGCKSGPEPAPADLVIRGTVKKMQPLPLPDSPLAWVITCSVDEVISGYYPDKTFTFRIQSPAKSEIKTGQQHTIRAMRSNGGYTVDGDQWRKWW